jgi:hypothetical protein
MPRRTVTPRKSVELDRSRAPLMLAALLVVGLGLTAGAIAWGKSDAGEINVAATINNSHSEELEKGESIQQSAAPEHAALPNGGLVAEEGNTTPPPRPTAEETASTSEPEVQTETVPSEEAATATDAEGTDEVPAL